MMPSYEDIPHVDAGDRARAEEQNAFIDRVNDHSDDLVNQDERIADLESNIAAACILRKSEDQTIEEGTSSGGDRLVTWDVTERDTAEMADTFADAIIIRETGTYLVVAQVNMQGGGTNGGTDDEGERVVYITHNGSDDVVNDSISTLAQPGFTDSGGVGNGLMTGITRYLDDGDELRVYVWQKSGTDLDLRHDEFGGCTFSVTKVG